MCNDKYRATFLNNPFPLKTSTETSWKKNMPGCLGNLLGMKYTNPVMWCIRSHVWLGQWSLIPSFEETETRLPMHSFCFQNVISLCKKNTLLQIIYPYSKSIHFDVCCFCFTRFLRRKNTTEISAVLLFLRNVPRLRGLQAFCFDRLRPPRFTIHENHWKHRKNGPKWWFSTRESPAKSPDHSGVGIIRGTNLPRLMGGRWWKFPFGVYIAYFQVLILGGWALKTNSWETWKLMGLEEGWYIFKGAFAVSFFGRGILLVFFWWAMKTMYPFWSVFSSKKIKQSVLKQTLMTDNTFLSIIPSLKLT